MGDVAIYWIRGGVKKSRCSKLSHKIQHQKMKRRTRAERRRRKGDEGGEEGFEKESGRGEMAYFREPKVTRKFPGRQGRQAG